MIKEIYGYRLNFETDDDTARFLEIVVDFLRSYFGYTRAAAVEIVNVFHVTWVTDNDKVDLHYHHDGAFAAAVKIHYYMGLKGDAEAFVSWRRENDLWETPPEALEYFRTKYFVHHAEVQRMTRIIDSITRNTR